MDEVKKALRKKALGYEVNEIVEEYVSDENGNQFLQKRKVTKKHNPPDLNALKVLLEEENAGKDYSCMTDSELEQEKNRLMQLLKEGGSKNENGTL